MNAKKSITDFEKKLGYTFSDKTYLDQALTHTSFNHHADLAFERLEFLGDRILGLVIADLLLNIFQDEAEGSIAVRHAALVSKTTCAIAAHKIELESFIKISAKPGESELADAFEAVIAAIYLDGGLEAAHKVIEGLYTDLIKANLTPPKDPKSALQEWAQARGLGLPHYTVKDRTGPDHSPDFEVSVTIKGQKSFSAHGASKKEAERNAAQIMLDSLND